MSATTTTINKVEIRGDIWNRWYYDVWWDDGDDTGHGIGGWAATKTGARFAAWRIARRGDA